MSIVFSPRCALLSKHEEGNNVHRVYDEAKTPMQRLMLSGVLSAESLRQLDEVVQALDPLRLLQHLERLQHALGRLCVTVASLTPRVSVSSILPFRVQECMSETHSAREKVSLAPIALLQRQQALPESTDVLDWSRTSKDPFEGQWELIASLALAHPEWSGNELFQQMHHLFPGRYLDHAPAWAPHASCSLVHANAGALAPGSHPSQHVQHRLSYA